MTATSTPVLALALAALAVLAGCGFATSPSGEAMPSVTPAPVPDDGRGPAPGLDEEGVASPARLADAHGRALDEISYTLVKRRIVTDAADGQQLDRVALHITAGTNRDPLNVSRVERSAPEYVSSASYSRIDAWYRNGSFRARYVDPIGVIRSWGNNDTGNVRPIQQVSERPLVEATLRAFDPGIADRVEADGTTRYRLRADGLSRPDALLAPPLVNDPANGTFEAVVDDRGRVRRLRVAYDASYRNRTVRVVQAVRITRVGATTPKRPEWIDHTRVRLDEVNETSDDGTDARNEDG